MEKIQSQSLLNSNYNRTFDESLKRSIIERFEKKHISIKEICELYSVSRTSVYKWIYHYSKNKHRNTKTVLQMESDAYNLKELKTRIAELERVVGQKQLQIDYLEKLIEIGNQELGVDLKKNYATTPSTGLKPTK